MKKTYFAPVMECETFETKDVITVSFSNEALSYGNDYAGAEKNVPTVDRNEFTFNPKE